MQSYSLALDFDEYMRDWAYLGTSMPSDANQAVMYQAAAELSRLNEAALYNS